MTKTVKFKNYLRKIKSLFMIHGEFESILVPKNNGKQNPDESYTNNVKISSINVECIFYYTLVCIDDQFSKPFKSYLGRDSAHKFMTNMVVKMMKTLKALQHVRFVIILLLKRMLK